MIKWIVRLTTALIAKQPTVRDLRSVSLWVLDAYVVILEERKASVFLCTSLTLPALYSTVATGL